MKHLITLSYYDSMVLEVRHELFWERAGTELTVAAQQICTDFGEQATGRFTSFNNPETFIVEYDDSVPLKENLNRAVEGYVGARRYWSGIPDGVAFSEEVTEEDWAKIAVFFTDKTRTDFTSDFAREMEEEGLSPRPYDAEKGQWVASCPSGGGHTIMVDVFSETFGCGYCRKQGGREQLREWAKEKKI